MVRNAFAIALVAALALTPAVADAQQANKRSSSKVERRGGYSYNQADTINTYGDARGRFGRSDSLRDPSIDRQTNFGPFDHGFFFDSGVGPRGGNSPYLN
jgi:hypothetical protein